METIGCIERLRCQEMKLLTFVPSRSALWLPRGVPYGTASFCASSDRQSPPGPMRPTARTCQSQRADEKAAAFSSGGAFPGG
jgi:hypothetical protein